MLANDPALELSGDSRRFSLWDSGAPRPRVLSAPGDLEVRELLGRLREAAPRALPAA